MFEARTLTLRQVAVVNYVQKVARFIFWLSLVAMTGIILYVVGMFVYEWLYPPAPVPGPLAMALGSNSHAPFLLIRALGWTGKILYVLALAKLVSGFTLMWAKLPYIKPLLLGMMLMLIAPVLVLLNSFSCGC